MTSKQRSNLKSLAAVMKPIAQVGKEGIGENLIKSLSQALEARELIKVNLLPASSDDGENLAANIADLLHAEVVAVIGRKAIFYRRSSRKDFEHIVFWNEKAVCFSQTAFLFCGLFFVGDRWSDCGKVIT